MQVLGLVTRTTVGVVTGIVLIGSAAALAANWEYEGTSTFKLQVYKGGPGNGDEQLWNAVSDHQYFALWSLAVDPAGNVYYTAGDTRNVSAGTDPNYPGGSTGVTIMKPDGGGGWTELDVDLSPNGLDLPGGVTKMTVAGDGKVYALQNWMPIPYGWWWRGFWFLPGADWNTGTCSVCDRQVSRILRINEDGTVDVIVEYSPAVNAFPAAGDPKWVNVIKGMDVGPDGNLYWWYAGTRWNLPGEWSQHVLWRYNVTTQMVEESPTAGTNNGWNDINQLNNFASVGTSPSGEMFFARVRGVSNRNKTWNLNPIGWSTNRTEAVNQQDEATSGHQYPLHMIYDPVLNKLWAGSWVEKESSPTNILVRYNGVPGATGLFDDALTPEDLRYGIQSSDVWHANGNDAYSSGIPNGGAYWPAAMALNPLDRSMWMSWGASDTVRHGTYNYAGDYGPVGNVYTVGPADIGPTGNEGNPQTAHPDPVKAAHPSRTIALAFTGTRVYASTVDLATLEFNLFSADIPIPATGACCQTGPACDETTENVCDALGGVWQGADTTCAQTDCRFKVCSEPFADADADGDVDSADFGVFQVCATYATGLPIREYPPVQCDCFDTDGDGDVDGEDLMAFMLCAQGPGVPVDPACDGN